MAVKIGESNPNKPRRVVICGTPGIGKSTFAAKSEKPIFLPLEDGYHHLTDANGNKVKIFEGVKDLTAVSESINYLLNDNHDFKTLVIDSADWYEKMVHAKIIGPTGTDIIRANKGYGAGYAESTKIHKDFLESLTKLVDQKGMNVIVTAHTHVRPVKDPSVMDEYDIFEMKCHTQVSDLWREWSDAFLFARKQVFTRNSDDMNRARATMDDQRVIVTEEQAFFKAKNRYKLPTVMNFDLNFWNTFMSFKTEFENPEPLYKEAMELANNLGFEIQAKACPAIEACKTNPAELKAHIARLTKLQPKEKVEANNG